MLSYDNGTDGATEVVLARTAQEAVDIIRDSYGDHYDLTIDGVSRVVTNWK
jgi:hypothetical protein